MTTAGVVVRVGALALAVALVVGGMALRDDGAAPVVADQPVTADDPVGVAAASVRCDSTLTDVCDVLDLDVEAEPAGDPADVDLTAGPWVAPAHVVADARAAAARTGTAPTGTTTAVASSPLVLVGRAERVVALRDLCGDPVDAACAADVVGAGWRGAYADWGRSSLAVAPVDADPVTALLVGAVVQADQDALDTRSLAGAGPLLSAMATNTNVDRRTTTNRLTASVTTPALTDFRVGLLADWLAVADLPRASGLDAARLTPGWASQVVLWLPDGALPGTLVEDLGTAFAERRWDGPDQHEPAPTTPAGVWEAVHETWTTLR